MDIIATQKFVRISPKKLRVVADVARKMSPLDAVAKLPFVQRRGSDVLLKVIKSALANAKEKGVSDDSLVIKEIQIGEGPRLKRGRAASRGRWHPYKRRMSHVRVVLITKELKNIKTEKQKNDGDIEQEKSTFEGEVKVATQGSRKNKPLAKSVTSVGKKLKSMITKREDKAEK